MKILCARCGSERLIPLTFTPSEPNRAPDLPQRPIAKCADCGERIFARPVVQTEPTDPA